jgi:hypothetical protein
VGAFAGTFDDQIPPLPFESDGCSGGLSKGWQVLFDELPPFQDCCYTHDMEYHYGGTLLDKLCADAALAWCTLREGVAATTALGKPVAALGYGALGLVMFLAVSVGGLERWKRPYSWGFGWHPEWKEV